MMGLTQKEAERRLRVYGANEIRHTKKINPWKIFLSQFTSPLILILIFAAIASIVIGFLPGGESSLADSAMILLIVFAAGICGFLQEYKAEKAIEALRRMATPKAKVIRDGKEMEIPARYVVPGDVIVIESGDVVPADAEIKEAFDLEVDESILTGESRAVRKRVSDKVFMNTCVTGGSAKAVVISTGMKTEIGRIAGKLQEIEEEKTAFQVELSKLSKKLSLLVLILTVIITLVGVFKYGWYQSLLTAIALAVAAVPEGLPAVVVLALALGANTMAKKRALIRKLSIVESVGAVDIICTDKTGTLTKNEMTVTKLFFDDREFDVTKSRPTRGKAGELLLLCGVLCNNSTVSYDEKGNKKYLGDQTEVALRKIGERFGFVREQLEKRYKRVNEIPFDPKRKMMSVVVENPSKKKRGNYIMFSKGAPEVLIERCDRIYRNGKIVKMSKRMKERVLKQNEAFASRALRVLGFAFKEIDAKEGAEKNLVWLGLQAMIDPPRPEVRRALRDCRTAGIRVIMITGDNPLTAKAIADEIGLETKGVVEGKDIDKMNDRELEAQLNSGINVFARTNPFHKLRILKILQKENRVAMTGDGVNDALALKKADVGIAMGKKGTEVAKEASDIILLDDNFSTIRNAIEEGRRIFDNIRKFVNYLLTCNFAEVGVLFLATLFLTLDKPVLLPIQILWINLLTDGMPALALGVDPPTPDIMRRPPRRKGEPILNRALLLTIILIGIVMTALLLATFYLVLPLGIEVARTTLFTGFILYEFVRIAAIRFQERLGFFANRWLAYALLVSLLLQLFIIYSPCASYFHTTPLGVIPWVVLISGTLAGFAISILTARIITRLC